MILLQVEIKISKIFDKCKYWTNNRAFLGMDNPNISHTVNYTYGMTDDDEEFFFREYVKTAVYTTADIFSGIRRRVDNSGGNSVRFDYNNDKAIFNVIVSDSFEQDRFKDLVARYIQFCVLKDWYYLKNIYQEVETITNELYKTEQEIIDVVVNGGSDKNSVVISYNDGFVCKPCKSGQVFDLSTIESKVTSDFQHATAIIANDITVNVGHSALLQYSLEPIDSIDEVKFRSVFINPNTPSFSFNHNTLIVTGLNASNNDKIAIFIEDANGAVIAQKIISVFVRNIGIIVQPLQDMQVSVGGSISLVAQATAQDGSPIVFTSKWYVNGVEVVNQYGNWSKNGNVLNLTNAQLTDTATVDLQILSGTWYATRSCNISVTQPSQAMIFRQEFSNIFE